MQANDGNQALKRVSSDEIKRNYTQITGREALERLFATEEVFSAGRLMSWKIIDGTLHVRTCGIHSSGNYVKSKLNLNAFLNSRDWYVAPPFDARKEMLARPGEWVAKYSFENGLTLYIGFDHDHMVCVESVLLEKTVAYDPLSSVFITDIEKINEAIPLDDADLAKLAALKTNEKGVEA